MTWRDGMGLQGNDADLVAEPSARLSAAERCGRTLLQRHTYNRHATCRTTGKCRTASSYCRADTVAYDHDAPALLPHLTPALLSAEACARTALRSAGGRELSTLGSRWFSHGTVLLLQCRSKRPGGLCCGTSRCVRPSESWPISPTALPPVRTSDPVTGYRGPRVPCDLTIT